MLELTSRESQSAEMFPDVDAEIDPVNPDFGKVLEILTRNGVTVETLRERGLIGWLTTRYLNARS